MQCGPYNTISRCSESASCMGPENVDRKTYPQKVGQISGSELLDHCSLAMRSDWLTASWLKLSSLFLWVDWLISVGAPPTA